MSRARCREEGLLPLRTDPVALGHLMARLEAACEHKVTYTLDRTLGPDGGAVFRCTLHARAHRRSWTGSCLGEAVAGALVAQWAAMARAAGRRPGGAQ